MHSLRLWLVLVHCDQNSLVDSLNIELAQHSLYSNSELLSRDESVALTDSQRTIVAKRYQYLLVVWRTCMKHADRMDLRQ